MVYATHIFDGLDRFPTHVSHMQLGKTLVSDPIAWPLGPNDTDIFDISRATIEKMDDPNRAGSKLMILALDWLEQDKQARRELEEKGVPGYTARGKSGVETTESEIFYKK